MLGEMGSPGGGVSPLWAGVGAFMVPTHQPQHSNFLASTATQAPRPTNFPASIASQPARPHCPQIAIAPICGPCGTLSAQVTSEIEEPLQASYGDFGGFW
jgi:hypothetical protein